MKISKIALRLILYFSAALLLFALVVGSAFSVLSARRTMDQYRGELLTRAQTVANTMRGFLNGTSQPANGSKHHESGGMNVTHGTGFGAYMRYLEELSMADVWVVNSSSEAIDITTCSEHMGPIEYDDLPPDGEEVIERALQGETAFSESFGELLGEPSLSVAVPIRESEEEEPLGAVLLHTPVKGISDAVGDSLRTMLFSVLVALFLAVPAGILLSLRFIRPLNRMKATAARVAEGDLTAKNGIFQKDEIGQLAQAMDQMTDRLQAASLERRRMEQARQDFFSSISHELRTPVTVLRGSLEALTDGVITDPDQVREYQLQMLGESKHLQRLVNDLLELSRLENMEFQISKSPLELHQLVEDVARSMRRVAEGKGMTLKILTEPGEMAFSGDYGRLRQMIITVLDNAFKFSPAGGEVLLELKSLGNRPVVSVTDHGPGIPPEQIPRIFERFHHDGGERNPGGTGLGLPISRQIALRHGIEIEVESREGNTVFSFVFPWEEPAR